MLLTRNKASLCADILSLLLLLMHAAVCICCCPQELALAPSAGHTNNRSVWVATRRNRRDLLFRNRWPELFCVLFRTILRFSRVNHQMDSFQANRAGVSGGGRCHLFATVERSAPQSECCAIVPVGTMIQSIYWPLVVWNQADESSELIDSDCLNGNWKRGAKGKRWQQSKRPSPYLFTCQTGRRTSRQTDAGQKAESGHDFPLRLVSPGTNWEID